MCSLEIFRFGKNELTDFLPTQHYSLSIPPSAALSLSPAYLNLYQIPTLSVSHHVFFHCTDWQEASQTIQLVFSSGLPHILSNTSIALETRQ